MTDTDARLIELAERCEAATGPDRELDIAILTHPAFGYRDVFEDGRLFDRGNDGYWSLEGDEKNGPLPSPTASLDAAMTLVPEGWEPFLETDICRDTPGLFWKWGLGHPTYDAVHGESSHAALALCAAALRARAALGDSK
ncbi:hypothetical protein [Sphingomonas segetis]|uniref:hypothetical protein n=1 Tax=Sphingomonas segetis TaxID=1104779 RepID=UPI0012D35837|nr:hypothetical protein [Sphingomonas segetis]